MTPPPEYINNFKDEINVDVFKNYGASKISLINNSNDNNSNKIPVKILDEIFNNFVSNKINIIKIDVEGAEKYVFFGSQKIIAFHKPMIIYEDIKKHTLDSETSNTFDKKIKDFNFLKFCFSNGYKHNIKIGYNSFLLIDSDFNIIFNFVKSKFKFIKQHINKSFISFYFFSS